MSCRRYDALRELTSFDLVYLETSPFWKFACYYSGLMVQNASAFSIYRVPKKIEDCLAAKKLIIIKLFCGLLQTNEIYSRVKAG